MDFAISSPMYKDQASAVTVASISINLEYPIFHSPWSDLTIPPAAMRFLFMNHQHLACSNLIVVLPKPIQCYENHQLCVGYRDY